MSPASSIRLLIIDPQNDFCDLAVADGAAHRPALPVPGADADMRRLARLIDRIGDRVDGIDVSLDSHLPIDIAHPGWWLDAEGRPPEPFTVIGVDDLAQGRWRTRDPAHARRSQDYVARLQAQGRHALIVWPEHCLIGHWGHNVHDELAGALGRWSRSLGRNVDYVLKGSNPFTEHYSALRAEVPDPADGATTGNPGLLARLASADRVLVAGEALSHCVASTVRDLADALGDAWLSRLVLIGDATSPVAGFEPQGQAFVREIIERGARCSRCDELLDPESP
ncbi:MAG TPA: cysteine hydrolase [Burkholderiaceae bacterium]|nr:cysteine hydrolase [Burkholderiaceae bacterium]